MAGEASGFGEPAHAPKELRALFSNGFTKNLRVLLIFSISDCAQT